MRKIFGKVFESKELKGIKNETKNKYNILLRASEASKEYILVEAICLKGVSEQKAKRDKGKKIVAF